MSKEMDSMCKLMIGKFDTNLVNYLLAHEGDIRNGVNDFGDLSTAFENYFGKPARTYKQMEQDGEG